MVQSAKPDFTILMLTILAAPNFQAKTTHGDIDFHKFIDGKWICLFSHPKDFTPVCTTELGAFAKLKPEFDARGVQMIGLVRRIQTYTNPRDALTCPKERRRSDLAR